jgi:hypothetical protein
MLLKLTSLHDISTLEKRRLVYVGETHGVGSKYKCRVSQLSDTIVVTTQTTMYLLLKHLLQLSSLTYGFIIHKERLNKAMLGHKCKLSGLTLGAKARSTALGHKSELCDAECIR